ncbi:universal stress protein [Halobellus clavatus]|jgi:nucleotide-binding universal stress UspA family protein|uniref:Nucleotide-binding universal stress protein, UspA family n=1 Tax=Halobellus clavatus TaxID=660517 RepID=A0A1H3GZT9_9EURY|nr:universal stress protein [Halobellus clavatus]SDY08816.1 Nucleotide-binding universal stress protein, UspA family [Halobellus clavatus]
MVRILLALDDEIPQARAQTNAIRDIVDTAESAEVYILHVFSDNPEGASVQQVEAVREAQERLESAGVHVNLLEASGSSSDEILRFADEYDVDQICVGGRKRSPTGKALFGSVTQDVILGTHRPVLVCGSTPEEE